MISTPLFRLLPLLPALLPAIALRAADPGPVMTACVTENFDGVRTALDNGADPNESYGDSQMTCLHYAALKGNFPLVKLLLERGADRDLPFKNETGDSVTAEQFARVKAHDEVADFIRDYRRPGGDSGAGAARRAIGGGSSGGGANPVMTPCATGDIDAVRAALDNGGDVNETFGRTGMTCLHVAAGKGNTALAQLLLERGADRSLPFKKSDGTSVTAEQLARANDQTAVANLIRDYSPPRRAINGGTSGTDGDMGPVMAACINEDVDGVRSALRGGADVNETWGGGAMTCLHVAALKGNRELAKVLLEGGANRGALFKKDDGSTITPEDVARAKNYTEVADFIRDFTPRRGAGALNAGDSGGDSGERLRHAAKAGDVAAVRSALQNGAKVNAPDSEGMSPLMYGVVGGSDEVVGVLLAAGANVDAQSDKGFTAAAFAVVGNKPSMVKKILARGGDPNLTISGVPLLALAANQGFTECGQALINAGADVNFKLTDGSTALSTARQKNFVDFVKMLQRNGASR